MEWVKRITLYLILVILFLPRIQEVFAPFESGTLKGAYSKAPCPYFEWKNWRQGLFQDSLNRYLNDSLPLRPFLVRVNNQADLSLFQITHGEDVVIGKRNNLFLMEYINGYLGIGYPPRQFIDDQVMKCRMVQDILWDEYKIFFLVVMAPDKATYMPDDIPDQYLVNGRTDWGRKYLAEKLQANGVHMIDFMPVFLQMKDTSGYPLFVETGIHWTNYGSFLAADSMFRYITAHSGYAFPEMKASRLEVTTDPKDDDNDVDRLLNLAWPTSRPQLAYPVITYESDTAFKKPSALFIGDSFYWAFYNQGIIQNMFSNVEFWFYDNLIFPESFTCGKSTRSVDLMEAVGRQNILVLLNVAGGWGNPGSGFVDRLFTVLDTSANNSIRAIENEIINNSQWLELVRKKAQLENVPLESKIRSEAIYIYNQRITTK